MGQTLKKHPRTIKLWKLCYKCEYDLSTLPRKYDNCPECGYETSPRLSWRDDGCKNFKNLILIPVLSGCCMGIVPLRKTTHGTRSAAHARKRESSTNILVVLSGLVVIPALFIVIIFILSLI
jgi:hypothetical protein